MKDAAIGIIILSAFLITGYLVLLRKPGIAIIYLLVMTYILMATMNS
jgi:hypothetical protein